MAANKTRYKIRGIAVYPKTDKAYAWDAAAKRSVADEDGTFELQVAVTAEKAKGLIAAFKKFYNENGKKGVPDHTIKEQVDKETGEKTGMWLVKATQYGKDKSDNVRKIAHFDAKAKPLPAGWRLTSGSEIILDCYPTVRKMPTPGVKLNIGNIQVVRYVEPQAYNPFEALNEEDAYDSATDTDADEEDAPFTDESNEDNGAESGTDF